jgi:hypothetical protein
MAIPGLGTLTSAEVLDVADGEIVLCELIPGVVALLTDDGGLRMPPEGIEYHGRAAIAKFLSTVPGSGRLERFRLIPTRANGRPAFGCYRRDVHAPVAHAYGLMVLTLSGPGIAVITGSPTPACSARSDCPERSRSTNARRPSTNDSPPACERCSPAAPTSPSGGCSAG